MSQALIDALDALENQVATLSKAVKSTDSTKVGEMAEHGAARGVSSAINGLSIKVGEMAEYGAARGVSSAIDGLSTLTLALQAILSELRQSAVPAAQRAQEAELRRKWWKPALIVFTVLLSLFSGFVVGVVRTEFVLKENTPESCAALDGSWSETTDGKRVCARWER